jgi:hypothetical protein
MVACFYLYSSTIFLLWTVIIKETCRNISGVLDVATERKKSLIKCYQSIRKNKQAVMFGYVSGGFKSIHDLLGGSGFYAWWHDKIMQ